MRTKNGFTLVEMLITVSIIAILVSTGAPALFQVVKFYRFEESMKSVTRMVASVRSFAISGKVLPQAEGMLADTDLDGIEGDLSPYRYVFEMQSLPSGLLSFRTYADFTDDFTYDSSPNMDGDFDILLSEKEITGTYEVTYNYIPCSTGAVCSLPIPAMEIDDDDINHLPYQIAFTPGEFSAEIWRNNGSSVNNIYQWSVNINGPEVSDKYSLDINAVSGVPIALFP